MFASTFYVSDSYLPCFLNFLFSIFSCFWVMGNVSVREGGRNPTGVGVEGGQFHSVYHAQGGS